MIWSVVAAGFVSLFVALLLVTGSRGPFTWWGVAIMVALWFVVPMAQRAQRLMREHPDLYITERWNRSDLAALGELVHARDLGYMRKVERRLARRGWQEKLPTLMPARFDQQDDDRKLEVYFPLKDHEGTVELGTVWWWTDGEWWWYGSIWPKSEDPGR